MIKKLEFRPHPLLRGGHLQTLAGVYWPDRERTYRAKSILLDVPGGDKIALHDDQPPNWQDEHPSALILHGLAGCHQSGYVVRLAERLNDFGIRTFRMDMRGTGASEGLAKLPGHAGRTEDAAIAIRKIAQLCPRSPLTMIGYSMGGNITLGTLANASLEPIGNLRQGVAVSPPVDLSQCCRELRLGTSRFYDKYLIRHLVRRWLATGGSLNGHRPRSIYEFDDNVTAPLSGFRDAEDYYAKSSSGPRLREVTLPTKILAAKDDPVVAFKAIESAARSEHVELFVTDSGGHLGFFGTDADNVSDGRKRNKIDYRWMDNLLVSWVTADVPCKVESV